MADTTGISAQKISELATTNSPASSDDLIIDTASGTRTINYGDLANAILDRLTSKSYSIDGSTQTIMSAISSLNSQVSTINGKINNTSSSSGVANYACTGWGTSVSLQARSGRNQFLVMASGYLFTAWIGGGGRFFRIERPCVRNRKNRQRKRIGNTGRCYVLRVRHDADRINRHFERYCNYRIKG